jgi:hypothetical protein
VPALVARLGGKQLYGEDPTVPLRELIQNASDAVRARRLLEERPNDWGDIVVRLGEDASGHWFEVEDSGVGMSAQVLTGPLLDFGTTYWGSSLMRYESPGLLAKGFNPTGRYGIGFFSVFMWGQHVRVTTRRPEEALRDTRVLEFSTGLSARPILKPAAEEEWLRDGGTKVRVWMKTAPKQQGGLLWRGGNANLWEITRLCEWLCPALDVHLSVAFNGGLKRVVTASDWLTMDSETLLRRIYEPSPYPHYYQERRPLSKSRIAAYSSRIRQLVLPTGQPVGRACVTSRDARYDEHLGVTTVGGLRCNGTSAIAGILVGQPTTAARNASIPLADKRALALWASEQSRLIACAKSETMPQKFEAACTIHRCGGDTTPLPIARGRLGWLRAEDIATLGSAAEILFVSDAAVSIMERDREQTIELDPNVLVVSKAYVSMFQEGPVHWPSFGTLPYYAVLEAVAKAWSASAEAVRDASDWVTDANRPTRRIGILGGKTIEMDVDILRKPRLATKLPNPAATSPVTPLAPKRGTRPDRRKLSANKRKK